MFKTKTIERFIPYFKKVLSFLGENQEVTLSEIEIISEYLDEITSLGLDINEFGGESYLIKAVPAVVSHMPPREILAGVLEQFAAGHSKRTGGDVRIENALSSMACKAAIKANHDLLPEESEALLRQMQEAGVLSHCPHGRPVMRIFSEAEIKKWFYRT